ncbi:hypothetical protein BDW62DRAFT_198933 [Aspergillus aurantiobrunneus]
MRVFAIFAALMAIAAASPALEARQQGENCESFSLNNARTVVLSTVTARALFKFAALAATKPVVLMENGSLEWDDHGKADICLQADGCLRTVYG